MKMKMDINDTPNFDKVTEKTKEAKVQSVKHCLNYLRKSVVNAPVAGTITKKGTNTGNRNYSKPGSKPRYWKNPSNRSMVYGSGGDRHSRFIGYDPGTDSGGKTTATFYASPEKSGDRVFQMLELGGSQPVEVLDKTSAIVDGRRARRDQRPGWKENHYKPMSKRSEGQQKHIKNYYQNIVTKRKKVKKIGTYEPRPFLMPTVQKVYKKFPEFFRKQIVINYR